MTNNIEPYELPVSLEGVIDEFDAAQILEISVEELREMRGRKRGPAYVAIVRDIVAYYPDVVFAYGDQVANTEKYYPLGF